MNATFENWRPSQAVADDFSGSSNLAFAFFSLSAQRRADMNVFYSFCRVVDDIADEEAPADFKAQCLAEWREALTAPPPSDERLLAARLREIVARYGIAKEHLLEIIDGVEMDLEPRLYATFGDLRAYCYRVASAVGLVSIEIFGYRDPACRPYAIELGLALQLTNILRDVAVDLDNGGRIYLPLEDLARFDYSEADLRARVRDDRYRALMNFEAQRAQEHYDRAVLPRGDRESMRAAEIMRAIYWELLQKLRREEFRQFEKRTRLSKARKIFIALRVMALGR